MGESIGSPGLWLGFTAFVLAMLAAREERCTVVPLRTDRPPRNYGIVRSLVELPAGLGYTPEM